MEQRLITPVEFAVKKFKPSVDIKKISELEGFPGLVFVICLDIDGDTSEVYGVKIM